MFAIIFATGFGFIVPFNLGKVSPPVGCFVGWFGGIS